MNIAIMADIHGNHIALEACIGEARKNGERSVAAVDLMKRPSYSSCTKLSVVIDKKARAGAAYELLPVLLAYRLCFMA